MGGNYMRPRTLYAVTVDNINKTCGQIITWKPKDGKAMEDEERPTPPEDARFLTVVSGPYWNETEDMVVDVLHPDGHESTERTSELGLTANRYTGLWDAIAIEDDRETIDIP